MCEEAEWLWDEYHAHSNLMRQYKQKDMDSMIENELYWNNETAEYVWDRYEAQQRFLLQAQSEIDAFILSIFDLELELGDILR